MGVFKSFKSAFSQACHRYVTQQPGRVVTADVLASLVGEAWPRSFNPVNIMRGFRKCGIQPFNPGKVRDRALCPSKGVTAVPVEEAKEDSPPSSPEKVELFEKGFKEGYDVDDPEYRVWLKLHVYRTESVTSSGCLKASSSSSDTSLVLSEILSLPKPPERKKKKQHN